MGKKLDWEKADEPDAIGQEWRRGPSANETKFSVPDAKADRRSAYFSGQVDIDPKRPANLKKLRNQQEAQLWELAKTLPAKERAALKRRVIKAKQGKA
ncbi:MULTISPECIES: hypothetical protein [Mesorhizobium]|uniref:hypothetical protein n=1 Tax=Mesorhizobium TaxID=68287 RepID=UPI0010A962E0|nr:MULTISPECIES: hypothetical protein [Mesorhizobium]MBZ9959337.1 hypothetical protein [Mesorhizobium sp. BR1-1-14]